MRRILFLGATAAAVFLLLPAQALAGTLTVNVIGGGSGEVSSVGGFEESGAYEGEPPIECSGPPPSGVCEDTMSDEGEGFETTFMTAFPDEGSEIAAWKFNEENTQPVAYCNEAFGGVEHCAPAPYEPGSGYVSGDIEVTAVFCLEGEALEACEAAVPPTKFPLSVTMAGSGTVTSSPAGIDCGSECEAEFEEGAEVELSASPEAGSVFSGWSGDCTGAGACEVTMDEAKEVSATFEPEQEALTVEVEGPGSVTAPEDIDCPDVSCGGNYAFSEVVELTATPDEGATFVEWTGPGADSCAGSPTPVCEVEMDEAKTVKAIFEAEPQEFLLSIAKAGTGSGTVASSPAGIDCGSTCKASFAEETEVTLKATPASGSTFAGWSGACVGPEACKVTMSEARSVTATFSAESVNPPSPPPPGEGIAKVASTAKVKAGKAALKLTCTGGPCKGTVKLSAKIKQAGRTKSLVIGKAPFSLAAGEIKILKLKLSAPAKAALAKGKALRARASGPGVSVSAVKLKPVRK